MTTKRSVAWKAAFIPTLVVLLFVIYPQINILSIHGSDWNGSYVVTNYDETAYSAYVRTLIDGRSRRNDPFTADDNTAYESLYSIQALPAYSIALPARLLGMSASTAFVILNFLLPIFAALVIFLFVRDVTDDLSLSSFAVFAVLCLGTAIVFEGELRRLFLDSVVIDFFPFARRYQPGLSFPVVFLFFLCFWRALTAPSSRRAYLYSFVSAALFVVLIYSYFFLWTAAAAWLACFSVLWIAARKKERFTTAVRVSIIAIIAGLALVPYYSLLSNRGPNTDETQLLSFTRMPDFFEIPEIIGAVLSLVLFYFVRKGKLSFESPVVLITLSMALTPFILFNQQIVTGRSLQPVHYKIFIANYLILTGLVLFVYIIKTQFVSESAEMKFRRTIVFASVAIAIWGFVESSAAANRNAAFESLRDQAMPALLSLRDDPVAAGGTVISTNLMVADFIPTVTSARSLWNPHTNSAGGVNIAENIELFHKYLYFSGYSDKDLANAINRNLFEVMSALFGGGRALPSLTGESNPVTKAEVEAEVKKYGDFTVAFNQTDAYSPRLTQIIVPAKAEINYTNIDRWYQRDEGKTYGLFKVYGLNPKPASH